MSCGFTRGPRSSTNVRKPARAQAHAITDPPAPEPTTQTSVLSTRRGCLSRRSIESPALRALSGCGIGEARAESQRHEAGECMRAWVAVGAKYDEQTHLGTKAPQTAAALHAFPCEDAARWQRKLRKCASGRE